MNSRVRAARMESLDDEVLLETGRWDWGLDALVCRLRSVTVAGCDLFLCRFGQVAAKNRASACWFQSIEAMNALYASIYVMNASAKIALR